LKKYSVVFNEGGPGICKFLIKSGKIILYSKNSKNKITLGPGKIFGELTLVKNNVKRAYDAKATNDSSFYSLEKFFFHEIELNFIHKILLNLNYSIF